MPLSRKIYVVHRPEAQLQAEHLKLSLCEKYGYYESEFIFERETAEPGDIQQTIDQHIGQSGCILLLVSKSLFLQDKHAHDWYIYTIRQAIGQSKHLIPIIYQEAGIESLKHSRIDKEMRKSLTDEEAKKLQSLRTIRFDLTSETEVLNKLHQMIEKTGTSGFLPALSATASVAIGLVLSIIFCITLGIVLGIIFGDNINERKLIQDHSFQKEQIYYYQDKEQTLVFDGQTKTICPPIAYLDTIGTTTLRNEFVDRAVNISKAEVPWYYTIWISTGASKFANILVKNNRLLIKGAKSGGKTTKTVFLIGSLGSVVVCAFGAGPGVTIGQKLKNEYQEDQFAKKLQTDPETWEKIVQPFEEKHRRDQERVIMTEEEAQAYRDSLFQSIKNTPKKTDRKPIIPF